MSTFMEGVRSALERVFRRTSVVPPAHAGPPAMKTLAERTLMTEQCRDADVLPKVERAGEVLTKPDSLRVQVMFNGMEVVAGGYYGDWMEDLIRRCRGHHEPQEEVAFAEVLRHVGESATMIELGAYWSFYSIWFTREGANRRAVVMEPDPQHLEVGRQNAALNGCDLTFVNAVSAGRDAPPTAFDTEESGVIAVPRLSVPTLVRDHSIDVLDILHCDAQGVEVEVLESCRPLAAAGRLLWLVVSTHAEMISGDPLTHQRCLALLGDMGATVLVEHDVHESFSGDGLIVAKFGDVPSAWVRPSLSYNRYSTSLFRNPLYDLAECRGKLITGS